MLILECMPIPRAFLMEPVNQSVYLCENVPSFLGAYYYLGLSTVVIGIFSHWRKISLRADVVFRSSTAWI